MPRCLPETERRYVHEGDARFNCCGSAQADGASDQSILRVPEKCEGEAAGVLPDSTGPALRIRSENMPETSELLTISVSTVASDSSFHGLMIHRSAPVPAP